MSDAKELNPETGDHAVRRKRRHGFWTGVFLGGVLGAVVLGGLAFGGAKAIAASVRPWSGPAGGFARHGLTPELRRERAEFVAEWVLRRVDATEDQQAQVKAIVGEALDGLFPLVERHRENRQALAAELVKPTIDRAALEALRKAELELAEEASSRLVAALAQAAEALTPEQRQQLYELAHRFGH
jgi:Spy/CpxP family protein refolding chaperone